MAITRDRIVPNNRTIHGQVDFFQSDGFTRVTGLNLSTLSVLVFFNNLPQPWSLTNGLMVTDAQVVSGSIYLNEITSSPGYYNIRWRPNAIGFWRLVFTYSLGLQTDIQDFDIVQGGSQVETGLSASFIRPDC